MPTASQIEVPADGEMAWSEASKVAAWVDQEWIMYGVFANPKTAASEREGFWPMSVSAASMAAESGSPRMLFEVSSTTATLSGTRCSAIGARCGMTGMPFSLTSSAYGSVPAGRSSVN